MLYSSTWNHLAVSKEIINIKFDKNTWWIELLMLNSNTWNNLSECKQMNFNSFLKNQVTYKLFAYKSFIKTGFNIK